ncbi:hypothetical protein BG58_39435 [Caballeronia jiangsuensis]|nr:hypothetical protein BG58_39435 [Caballeronia jiangsuensis]
MPSPEISQDTFGADATLIDMPVITRSFFLYSAPDFARSLQQHEDIAYAVRTHDGQLASNLMESHIRLSYRRFMKERIDSSNFQAEAHTSGNAA